MFMKIAYDCGGLRNVLICCSLQKGEENMRRNFSSK
jgi:hypothetical protein